MPRAGSAVSVLMPVHNGAAYLREAVESVLGQTYGDFELLIIDDGSTDGSAEVIASYRDPRIRVLTNDGRCGLVTTLNRGLALARGELMARQDADDRSHPERLARQVAWFRRYPALVLLGTQARVIDRTGRPAGVLDRPQEHVSIRWYHLFDNGFIHSTVMFRRDAARTCGGYERLLHCEDYALWSRLTLQAPVMNLAERLVDYRTNPDSVYGMLTPEEAAVSTQGSRWVIQRNLQGMFGDEAISPQEMELLSGFRWGVRRAAVEAFLELFHRLRQRYQRVFPESIRSADFRRTIARQYDDIAYKLSPSTRRMALQVYAAGILRDPALTRSFSWPRVLALTVLGKEGRDRIRARWAVRAAMGDGVP